MIRAPVRILSAALAALGAAGAFGSVGCGGGKQQRPEIVATFPTDGQSLSGWLHAIRVTYDVPVGVLNPRAARLSADGPDGGGQVVLIREDPADDHSILIVPDLTGHFVPGVLHTVAVLEGAAVDADGHYRLDEYEFTFTLGPVPNLFLSAEDGNVYETDPATAAQVFVTSPGAGFLAREPASTDGRIWVWRDPSPGPGSSLLSTFTPGTATITQDVALSGETGVRTGDGFAVSFDGRTLYASARDAGTNRLFVHRIDAATQVETGSLQLSIPLNGNASHRPCVDPDRDRLYVAVADGAGGGFLAVVDLATFTEADMVAGPGVDALPLPAGAGDLLYDVSNEVAWMLDEAEGNAAIVLIEPDTFAQVPTPEPAFVGSPVVGFPTPDGRYFVQGLDGYAGTQGLVRSRTDQVGEGFAFDVSDDVGGVSQGCFRIRAVVRDPASVRFFVFPDNGLESFFAVFDTADTDFVQEDLDGATAGVQVIDFNAAVTGGTTLLGAVPP